MPLQKRKETLSIPILFCPITWLWSCDFTTMVPEAPTGAWGIWSSVAFIPEESQSVSQTVSVLCKSVLFSSFWFSDVLMLAKCSQGWSSGSLKRNGFMLYWCLIKCGEGPIFSPSWFQLITCQSWRKRIYNRWKLLQVRQLLTNQKRRICHHSIWTAMRSPLFLCPPKHFSG